MIGIVDDNSLFYAAQTLKQLAKYDEGKKILPLCSIKDYPDVLFRGTVEGFYGQPWSHADRIEQIRFYGRIKLNTYIYGPKDDPYHSSPNWRKPYPAEEAEHIKELAEEATHNKVNFVWAIHPGQDIQWNLTDSMNILSKFEKMYDLGVRSFAVFFDDISGEGARPEKQAGLLNYIHKEFITKKNDVQPLIMCLPNTTAHGLRPIIWISSVPNSTPLSKSCDRRPCRSRYHERSVEWVNNRIRRPAYIWWNFPVSDYCQDHLLMGPAYGLDTQAAGTMTDRIQSYGIRRVPRSLYSALECTLGISRITILHRHGKTLATSSCRRPPWLSAFSASITAIRVRTDINTAGKSPLTMWLLSRHSSPDIRKTRSRSKARIFWEPYSLKSRLPRV